MEVCKSLTKLKDLKKNALNYLNSYKRIMEKAGKYFIDVKRKHKHCIELNKTLNNLNLSFIK